MKKETCLWDAVDAAAATAGRSRRAWQAQRVVIDSRDVKKGDLFVALRGETQDGHQYVNNALERGASAAMVSYIPENTSADAPLLVVDDTIEALIKLGDFAKRRSKAIRIAVTGSVGKTGTRELIRAALNAAAPTFASKKSHNNHVGVPLSLANLPPEAAFAVFEIGMNHPGEIRELNAMVEPKISVITKVAPAHMMSFDSLEGVARAKAEVFEHTLYRGVALIGIDHEQADLLVEEAQKQKLDIVTFGRSPDADCRLVLADQTPARSTVVAMMDNIRYQYSVPMPGTHWVDNSLCVPAVIKVLGLKPGNCLSGLQQLSVPPGRGQQRMLHTATGDLLLIDESYNANPSSMEAALRVLAQHKGRKIAVLGEMLELGSFSPAMHADLADVVEGCGVDLCFCCGSEMLHLKNALEERVTCQHAPTSAELAPLVLEALKDEDVVLVKGSLGSAMHTIISALNALGSHQSEGLA